MDFPQNSQAFPDVDLGSATQPTLTVQTDYGSGTVTVDDGSTETISAGARSLTLTPEAGATVETSVELASTGAAIPVTNPTSNTPSWTAPSGGSAGDACNVLVVATKDGLTTRVGFTERIAGSGGGSATYEEIARWTFAGADVGSLTGSGTITTDAGATDIVDFNKFLQSGSASTDTLAIVAGGLQFVRSGGNSVGGAALDLSDVRAACEPERDTLLAMVHFDDISGTEVTSQNIIVGFADVNNSISNNPNRGLYMNVVGAGTDVDILNRQFTSGASNVKLQDYGTGLPSSGTMLFEVSASRIFAGWSDLAAPDRQDFVSGTNLGSSGQASGSPGPTLPSNPYTWLTIAVNPQVGGSKTLLIPKIVWYRLAQGATP